MIKTHRKFIMTPLLFVLGLLAVPAANADETTELFENLVPVEDARVGMEYRQH